MSGLYFSSSARRRADMKPGFSFMNLVLRQPPARCSLRSAASESSDPAALESVSSVALRFPLRFLSLSLTEERFSSDESQSDASSSGAGRRIPYRDSRTAFLLAPNSTFFACCHLVSSKPSYSASAAHLALPALLAPRLRSVGPRPLPRARPKVRIVVVVVRVGDRD
mgnify:CR=1 FL=1